MNHSEFDRVTAELTKRRNEIAAAKRPDYTIRSVDVLANFKTVASHLGNTPAHAWYTYFWKHLSAIISYITDPDQPTSEPIVDRIADAMNYLELLHGIIREGTAEGAVAKAVKKASDYFDDYIAKKKPQELNLRGQNLPCDWPGCDRKAICTSGNVGGACVCEYHFQWTNGPLAIDEAASNSMTVMVGIAKARKQATDLAHNLNAQDFHRRKRIEEKIQEAVHRSDPHPLGALEAPSAPRPCDLCVADTATIQIQNRTGYVRLCQDCYERLQRPQKEVPPEEKKPIDGLYFHPKSQQEEKK